MNKINTKKNLINVSAALIYSRGKILITRRKTGEQLAGFWEFPGGKIEKDETPQECLERELLEELGVTSKATEIITEHVYQYDKVTINLIGIKTDLLNSNIKLSVHDKAAWVDLDKVLNFKLAPADIPIAQIAIKYFNA